MSYPAVRLLPEITFKADIVISGSWKSSRPTPEFYSGRNWGHVRTPRPLPSVTQLGQEVVQALSFRTRPQQVGEQLVQFNVFS